MAEALPPDDIRNLPQVGSVHRGGYNFIKRRGASHWTGEDITVLEFTRNGHTLHCECPSPEYTRRCASMLQNLIGAIEHYGH